MDTFLAKAERKRADDEGVLIQCPHCFHLADGKHRREALTRLGWHLRMNHAPDYGYGLSTSSVVLVELALACTKQGSMSSESTGQDNPTTHSQ
jgi:hypothetical protein